MLAGFVSKKPFADFAVLLPQVQHASLSGDNGGGHAMERGSCIHPCADAWWGPKTIFSQDWPLSHCELGGWEKLCSLWPLNPSKCMQWKFCSLPNGRAKQHVHGVLPRILYSTVFLPDWFLVLTQTYFFRASGPRGLVQTFALLIRNTTRPTMSARLIVRCWVGWAIVSHMEHGVKVPWPLLCANSSNTFAPYWIWNHLGMKDFLL